MALTIEVRAGFNSALESDSNSMKTWMIVIAIVLADSAGNLLLTRGMRQVGEVRSRKIHVLLQQARCVFRNPMIGLGILCLAIAFFLLIALLSWADLSFIVPATALNYPLSLWGSRYFLGEQTSRIRWIGTILVCIGVALTALS